MFKRYSIALFLIFVLNIYANAYMVSFFVLETGVDDSIAYSEHSVNWESAFMDVFFDAGFIVSNAPSIRMRTRPDDIVHAASYEFDDALRGGVDYFFIVQLDYTQGEILPGNVTIYLYKIIPFAKITERTMAARRYVSSRDEFDDYKSILRGFIPLIN